MTNSMLCIVLVLHLLCFSSTAATGEHPHVEVSYSSEIAPALKTSKEHSLKTQTTTTRRMLIGSTAPICTYNECRTCKSLSNCKARLVPIDPNDPMNSPYHYRCLCH